MIRKQRIEFQEDVINYLISRGYDIKLTSTFDGCTTTIYCGGRGNSSSISGCPKGIDNELELIGNDELEKYLLNFIGSVLRKHNIIIQRIHNHNYKSYDLKFEKINRV